MDLDEVASEAATQIFGGILPGPASVARRTVVAFLAGAASLVATGIGTHHLFSTGQPYSDPDWAFEVVVEATVGGIFAFVLGLACWSKATEARAIPAIASACGLIAMVLFPLRLLLGG